MALCVLISPVLEDPDRIQNLVLFTSMHIVLRQGPIVPIVEESR